MGESDIIYNQNFRTHSYKKATVEDWSCKKNEQLIYYMSVQNRGT